MQQPCLLSFFFKRRNDNQNFHVTMIALQFVTHSIRAFKGFHRVFPHRPPRPGQFLLSAFVQRHLSPPVVRLRQRGPLRGAGQRQVRGGLSHLRGCWREGGLRGGD